MKLLAYILMTICLSFGTLSATTAYSPPLDLPDESLIGLTLNADAGKIETTDDEPPADAHDAEAGGGPRPIAVQGDELTPELLATLRDAGVERVRVKEFSVQRWDYAWLMVASCAGLIVAAMILKLQARREIAAKLEATPEPTETPEHALAEIRATVDSVLETLPSLKTDHERNHLIIEQIGSLQWTHLQAILDARSTLIARLRLSGFAHFMDRYSALERQLNRAWSAAADDVFAESEKALRAAHALLPEVEAKLDANSTKPAT